MALRSMTGFARADGGDGDVTWTWEIRSVNGRGLDLRVRIPPGFEFIEVPVRAKVAEYLTRGNVQINLSMKVDTSRARLVINQDVLAQVAEAVAAVRDHFDATPPTVDGILSVRGVLESESIELDQERRAILGDAMLADLAAAAAELAAARVREGTATGHSLYARLDEMNDAVGRAEAAPGRTPEAVRARLAEQVAVLAQNQSGFDATRLHQEAVLLATRADIREELDRLSAHTVAARDLLDAGGPVGRKLDFLSQELNREVNTLCAKSNNLELTEIGLELKAFVDQFREQVQNLE